jgi:hypothetical protein
MAVKFQFGSAATPEPAGPSAPRRSAGARGVLTMIAVYQAARAGHPSPCRFFPTCSSYAAEAVERHGATRGLWLALRRIGRCHPWGGKGIDLVPTEVGTRRVTSP